MSTRPPQPEIFKSTKEGAYASELEQLLPKQYRAAKRILLGVLDIARTEGELRAGYSVLQEYQWEQWGRRPQQVFFIDGARGAGKTYVLMAVLNFIRQLGRGGALVGKPPLGPMQRTLIKETIDSLKRAQTAWNKELGKELINLFEIRRFQRAAIVLPTIFPADTEGTGASMEVVFAAIHKRLLKDIDRSLPGEATRFKDLLIKLADVTRRWTFSKNLGIEAILSDSLDYPDFVDKRTTQSRDSNLRIDAWREFINEFCDAHETPLLVLGIDDTDVLPELTVDILHSLRMYLDHPRIVTVLAGNLRAMRQSLVYTHLSRIETASRALHRDNAKTLEDWRRYEREEIEQYLEKILPRWRRNFIGSPESRSAPDGFDNHLRPLFNDHGMDALCAEMLKFYRGRYVEGKVAAALQYQSHFHDRIMRFEREPAVDGQLKEPRPQKWNAEIRTDIENFVAWWLYRHSYATKLRPSTARQAIGLRRYIEDCLGWSKDKPALKPGERTKRLSVIIFENPDNYLLTQRFDDSDKVITEWLSKQELRSNWVYPRWISVNGRKLPEDSYSYEAICFRIDLIFARPLRFHEDGNIPTGLLPTAAGTRSVAPFYAPANLSDVPHFGIGAAIDHAAIPRNCVFLTDLRVLPAATFLQPSMLQQRRDSDRALELAAWESYASQDMLRLFGNDPRSAVMRYLCGWVAPILAEVNIGHGPLSWQADFSQCRVGGEFAEWKKHRTENVVATKRGAPVITSTSAEIQTTEPLPSPAALRERIARYLALFTALRYAWAATAVFTNALEHSINNGVVDDATDDLSIRGTLSQDVARSRYMFLDYERLKEAISVVPWLRKALVHPKKNDSAYLDAVESLLKSRASLSHSNRASHTQENDFRTIFNLRTKHLFDATVDLDREIRKARTIRHFLLYIVGLNAALPALIHTELAALRGIGNFQKIPGAEKKALQEVLSNWKAFILRAYAFLLRAEIGAAWLLLNAVAATQPGRRLQWKDENGKETDKTAANLFDYQSWKFVCSEFVKQQGSYNAKLLHFTLTPDISVSTLFGEPIDMDDEASTQRRLKTYSTENVEFCGLFEQARINLWLGYDFIAKVWSELRLPGNYPAPPT